jgi:hypothetical protein
MSQQGTSNRTNIGTNMKGEQTMDSEKLGGIGLDAHNQQSRKVYTKPKLIVHGTVEEITRCSSGQPVDGFMGTAATGCGKYEIISGSVYVCLGDLG